MGGIAARLAAGQVVCGRAADLPEEASAYLAQQEIGSLAVVPIFVGAEWFGFVGFSDHDRERRWTAAELDSLHTAAGLIAAAIKRECAQRARQRSEARYRQLFDNVFEGIYEVDPQGRIVAANRALLEILGVASAEELPGLVASDLYADPGEREHWVRRLVDDGEVRNVELTLQRRDGRSITVLDSARAIRDDDGQLLGFQGALVDITERKRSETALRQLSLAVEQSPASVIITDTRGRIEYVNAKFERVTGYPREEVIGRTPRFLVRGRIGAALLTDLWRTVRDGGTWRGEVESRKKDGELFWDGGVADPQRERRDHP